MGGVLVDNDETVLGFGDDIGGGDLAPRDAHRVVGDGYVGGFGASGGMWRVIVMHVPDGRLIGATPDPSSKGWRGEICTTTPLYTFVEGLGVACLTGPRPQSRRARPWLAAVPCAIQRRAQAADNQTAHKARIAEADFGFGGMDVDVDHIGGDVEEQRNHCVPVSGKHVCVSAPDRADQETVLHRPPVDEEILVVGDPTIEGRQSRNAAKRDAFALEMYGDTILDQHSIRERRDARRLILSLRRQSAPSIMFDRKANVGPRHREPFHDVDAGRIFAARRAEKLAARRDFFEQPFDQDTRARRERMRAFIDQRAVIDHAHPALATRDPALDRHPRDAGNRGQGLAAKAHRRHGFDGVGRQFRCGVAIESQSDVARSHAAAVITDVNAVGTTRRKPHVDPRCPGINRVFDQFLERGRRAFDNLARCDAINQVFGQAAY